MVGAFKKSLLVAGYLLLGALAEGSSQLPVARNQKLH
jgi:hypothetical protein